MVSEKGLEKFIDLYEKKYNVRLSKKDALLKFTQLLRIVKFIAPVKKKKLNPQKKHCY